MERLNMVMYTVGIMITLIGVASLVKQRSEDIYGSAGRVKSGFVAATCGSACSGNANVTLPSHHHVGKYKQIQTQSLTTEKWKS